MVWKSKDVFNDLIVHIVKSNWQSTAACWMWCVRLWCWVWCWVAQRFNDGQLMCGQCWRLVFDLKRITVVVMERRTTYFCILYILYIYSIYKSFQWTVSVCLNMFFTLYIIWRRSLSFQYGSIAHEPCMWRVFAPNDWAWGPLFSKLPGCKKSSQTLQVRPCIQGACYQPTLVIQWRCE